MRRISPGKTFTSCRTTITLVAGAFMVCAVLPAAHAELPDPAGVYLFHLSGCLIVEPGRAGRLEARYAPGFRDPWRVRAVIEEGRLILYSSAITAPGAGGAAYLGKHPSNKNPEDRIKDAETIVLVRSDTRPGDWDLVEAARSRSRIPSTGVHRRIYDAITSADNLRDIPGRLKKHVMDPIEPYINKRSSEGPRMKSFLRRVDDPRVIDFIAERTAGDASPVALQMIRALTDAHRDDPFLALHRIELEARIGDREAAESLWEEWTRNHSSETDETLLGSMAFVAQGNLLARRFHEKYPAIPPLEKIFAVDKRRTYPSRDDQIQWLTRLLKTDCLQGFFGNLWFTSGETERDFVPHKFQMNSFCYLARSRLDEGRQTEALEILAATYRLGLELRLDPLRAEAGALICITALSFLEDYLAKACETPEAAWEFLAAIESLQQINANLPLGPQSPREFYPFDASTNSEILLQVQERNAPEARMALLREEAEANALRRETEDPGNDLTLSICDQDSSNGLQHSEVENHEEAL